MNINPETKRLQEKIIALKAQTGAQIFAHYYQPPEIQQIADVLGDSLFLAQQIRKFPPGSQILYAAVDFMAECGKLLNPECHIYLPAKSATCPMANFCPDHVLREYRETNPEVPIVLYINSTTSAKVYADVICTSASAKEICLRIQKETGAKKIGMGPDKNLAHWVSTQTGIPIDYLPPKGHCIVHDRYSKADVLSFQTKYPGVKIIVHPECPPEVVAMADFVGSTGALLKYLQNHPDEMIGVGTEQSFLDYANASDSRITAIPLKNNAICVNMKKNSLESLLDTLEHLGTTDTEIFLPLDIIERVLSPLQKMINWSKR
jgi:quinolinate synthase